MKSSFKKLPDSQIDLEVRLDQKEFASYYQAVREKALASVHLKGFRPGTAPKELAEQALDQDAVFNEAAKSAIHWSLDEISKDNEWTLIDAPQITVEDSKDMGIIYKARLTVFPEIKLGNYKKIAKKVMADKKEQKVESSEIEQALEWIRNSRKTKEDDKAPELTDDFAKSLGKFQTVDELKRSVSDGLLFEKNEKEKERLRLKMIEEIIKDSQVDLPEIMVKKTYDNMEKQLGPIFKSSGKSEDEIKKSLMERARQNVASNLVIYKIAQAEKLEPKPEEIADDGHYDYNYGVAQNQKVFSFLEKQ